MSSKEFGTYSHDPRDAAQEYAEKRTSVTREIEGFILSLHPKCSMWEVSTSDGSSVPRALSGRFTDLNAFRQQLAINKVRLQATAAAGESDGA